MKKSENDDEIVLQIFCVPTPSEKRAGMYPIRLGRIEAKPNYQFGPRLIPYYSLYFVLDGEGAYVLDEQTAAIAKGDLFCLYPNRNFTIRTHPTNKLRLCWLVFNGELAEMILERIGFSPEVLVMGGMMDHQVNEIFEELWISSSPQSSGLFLRTSLMYKLFDRLCTNRSQELAERGGRLLKLDKGLVFMEMHFTEGITVEDVAAYVGVHRSYFSTLFSSEKGITPAQYLISLKMMKAVNMLSDPVHSITEIAASLGYIEVASFTKAFKQYFGASPMHYRKQMDLSAAPGSGGHIS